MYILPSDAVAGSIVFTEYLDTTKDIVVTFDYACYGPSLSGSEGFCVFFTNTFAANVFGGGPGPGLGYSAVKNINFNDTTVYPSVGDAVLGIGFDLTGNFGCSAYTTSGYADTVPNSIVLRADQGTDNALMVRTANLNNISAFPAQFSLYQVITGDQTPVYNRIRVRLTDYCTRIVIDIKPAGTSAFLNYLDYNISQYNQNALSQLIIPASLWCGLSFTTGQITDTTFKIKGFYINGIITSTSGASRYTYTYTTDQNTLNGSVITPYQNAGGVFTHGDTLSAVDIKVPPNSTNPALTGNPLVLVSPVVGPPGAPYQSADNYIVITSVTDQ